MMDAKIDTSQENMEARIEANSGKCEVLQGAFVSQMDVHQAQTVSPQEEMKAKLDVCKEKMETAIHSIWFE
jgi:hypothetical protein